VRTTLDLDDRILDQAKRLARDRGETLTRFIEQAIRAQLAETPRVPEPAQVPTFQLTPLTKKGQARRDVDWDDRDSIHEHMEDRRLEAAGPEKGLASLSGGWEGSEELADRIMEVRRSRRRRAPTLR